VREKNLKSKVTWRIQINTTLVTYFSDLDKWSSENDCPRQCSNIDGATYVKP
jgi:hypothetical protein